MCGLLIAFIFSVYRLFSFHPLSLFASFSFGVGVHCSRRNAVAGVGGPTKGPYFDQAIKHNTPVYEPEDKSGSAPVSVCECGKIAPHPPQKKHGGAAYYYQKLLRTTGHRAQWQSTQTPLVSYALVDGGLKRKEGGVVVLLWV